MKFSTCKVSYFNFLRNLSIRTEFFVVYGRMDRQPSRTQYSHFGSVRSSCYISLCHTCKRFIKKLTFVGPVGAAYGNVVTVVFNCYDVESPTVPCCKSDINECYCVEVFFEYQYWNYIIRGRPDFILRTDS
jgi:hypothetical protein